MLLGVELGLSKGFKGLQRSFKGLQGGFKGGLKGELKGDLGLRARDERLNRKLLEKQDGTRLHRSQ